MYLPDRGDVRRPGGEVRVEGAGDAAAGSGAAPHSLVAYRHTYIQRLPP